MNIRLTTKLILSIVIVEAVMLFFLVWNSTKLINDSHSEIFHAAVKDNSLLLSNAIAPSLAAYDRALINDTLSLEKENNAITYIAVYDYNNTLFAEIKSGALLDKHYHKVKGTKNKKSDTVHINKKIYLASQYLGELHVNYSLSEISKQTNKTRNQNTAIAIVALILSIIATLLIAYYLNLRIKKLEQGALQFASGNLNYRIDISGNDELSNLSSQFNNMAEKLALTQIKLKEKNLELQVETSHLKTLMNSVNAVVLEATIKGRFIYVSDEAHNLLGYEQEKWLEKNFWFTHIHPEDITEVKDNIIKNTQNSETTYSHDYRMKNNKEEYIWVRSINNIVVKTDGTHVIRGLLIDIEEEKKAEQRIVYLAEHDALTGLTNRRCFQDELDAHIALAKRYNYEGAVLFIDLDQFKYINDTLGHQGGDQYLIKISQCLQNLIRGTDILGRLGGDEFGIILTRSTEKEINNVCKKIIHGLREEIIIESGLKMHTSASIGIAIYPRHGEISDELLAKADAAMYEVKAKGRNNFNIYDDEKQQLRYMRQKVKWEERIREALKNDLFRLYFQPIVEIKTGKVKHHEVLLRMYAPDTDEIISPGEFLGTAEKFGLIQEIDSWVIENAIRLLASREQQTTGLSINLSGRNFGNRDFLNKIMSWIKKYDANPKLIVFEVTETVAVDSINQARDFIEDLRIMGCRFSLDDFGVGFSSLHYLRNLPVDIIKIDGVFIRNIVTDKSDQIMVKAITHISEGLGIKTVAEFVEDEKIYIILKELGVDMAQGYFIEKALPKAKFEYPDLPT